MKSPLYQSIRSNYCGIYSTANLLKLHDRPIDRKTALSLYGFTRKDKMNGLCDQDISNVLRKEFPRAKLRWRSYKEFSLETCDKYLCKHNVNLPTLIVFKIDHHLLAEPGYHCAIVVGYQKSELILLDSLALRNGYPFNAYLTGDKANWGDYLVFGAPYVIKPDSFKILTGLPRISLR